MDTVHSCRRDAYRFFKQNPDAVFMATLSPDQVMYMANRYTNEPNPNMKGMSYLPQEGDDGIGYRYTKPKPRPDPEQL